MHAEGSGLCREKLLVCKRCECFVSCSEMLKQFENRESPALNTKMTPFMSAIPLAEGGLGGVLSEMLWTSLFELNWESFLGITCLHMSFEWYLSD